MLFVKNLTKSFGAQTLFDGADFQLNRGEKIGIIGRNGHGKSTLINLLQAPDNLDEGEIIAPDNYRIGALAQHLNFDKPTIAEEVAQVLPPEEQHEAWRAEKLLSGLGFKPEDFKRPASEFSGGYQIRIKLAALLLSEPNGKERARQEKFIREFRAGARSAGLVQSRVKMLAKKGTIDALAPIPPINFKFTETPFTGAKMLEAHNLHFNYPDGPELLKSIGLELFPGDRVGIVGANGQGKTTLLQALAGELSTSSGTLKKNDKTHIGYLGQSNVNRLDASRTIVEELLTAGEVGEQQARGIAGSLLFSGDLAYKRVEVLSGGEKARVNLGKILLTPVNVLFLDEPTNHLDYESVQALITAVKNFDGAVVFVTHDERFLREVAQTLIVFDGGEVKGYDKNYDQFLAECGFASEAQEVKMSPLEKTKSSVALRKQSQKELHKLLRPLKRQLKDIEKVIAKLEADQARNKEAFDLAYRQGNKLKMETLGIEYQDLQSSLEKEIATWDEVGEKVMELEV